MAEHRPGGEPTEPPSEKKLREARRRGDVPRSKELTSALVFLAVAAAVAFGWTELVATLRAFTCAVFRTAAAATASPGAVLEAGASTMVSASLPVLGAAFAAAVLGGLTQVRPLFTLKPLSPSPGRLNPLKNVKNILGKQALFELFKSLVKVVGLGYVAFTAVWDHLPAILATLGKAPEQALLAVAGALGAVAIRVAMLMAVLAAADLLYQRHAYRKRQRMTKVELQREQKETEGDPQRKAERQRVHREIIEHAMLESVARADCVIINPDHVAVALRYDRESMDAPRIVARGRRLMAAKIRHIARQHGVPVVRNVPLARALVELELDDEIPEELYEAVAEVLRFVYQLSSGAGHRGPG